MARPKKQTNVMTRFGMHMSLRALVDGSGLSRYEIAKRSGIAESVLSRTYNGARIPTVDVVEGVAKAVGAKVEVTVSWGRVG